MSLLCSLIGPFTHATLNHADKSKISMPQQPGFMHSQSILYELENIQLKRFNSAKPRLSIANNFCVMSNTRVTWWIYQRHQVMTEACLTMVIEHVTINTEK